MEPDPNAANQTMTAGFPSARTFASGRYTVRRTLGEGGQKVVYLVHDEALDRDCALSMVKAEMLESDDLERLRREAQAMARLGAHSNIVTVHDIGDEDGKPYLVCEYVPAGDLGLHLRDAAAPLTLERSLAIAADIARALAVAHGRGVIHRDVKPGNVWLCEDGSAKLGDFGLAFSIDRTRMTIPGTAIGTATYMAPEQARGEPADGRTDLYALGVMLYEMVCGLPPFTGDNPLSVISQHATVAPTAPVQHVAGLPPALNDLILRLLAKSPALRPASAAALGEELREITESLRTPVQPAMPELEELDNPPATPGFVGRTPELEQLAAALDRTTGGAGSLVMVVGEPGIGKTRLIEQFAARARDGGARVLTGRCYDGDWAPPFSPFVEAIKQHAVATSPQLLRAHLGVDAGVLARIVPALHERLPNIADPPAIPAEGERYRLLEAVSDTLGRLAVERPLVLVLDDLHWADKGTIAMLQQIARTSATQRVLVLGAYRDVELDRTHPLADALAGLRREKNFERIALRGLEGAEVAELLDVIAEQDVPAALSEAIARETDGNPFFIKEVLLHLVEEGKIVQSDGTWTSKLSIAEMGIPEGVREVIGRRLSRLGGACNALLTSASAMTGGFSWTVLCAICEEAERPLLDALDEALDAHVLVESAGGTYDFTHALIRHTLYDELSTPRRLLLHRRIGEALEALYADDIEAHQGELAHHFFAAGGGSEPPKAATYALRAGEQAMKAWAFEEAGRYFEHGLELFALARIGDESLRCRLLVRQAYAEVDYAPQLGIEHALLSFDLARNLDDPELIALSAFVHAQAVNAMSFVQELRSDLAAHMEASLAVLQAALEALPAEDSSERSQISAELSQRLHSKATFLGPGPAGDPLAEQAQALADDALEIAERLNDPRALRYALHSKLYMRPGPDNLQRNLDISTRLIEIEQSTGAISWARFNRGAIILTRGEIDALDIEMSTLDAEIAQLGTTWEMALWKAMRAHFGSPLDEAEAAALEAMSAASTVLRGGGTNLQAVVPFYMVRREQGRLAEIEPLLRELAQEPAGLGPIYRVGLALVYAELDRPDDAAATLDRLEGEVRESNSWATLVIANAATKDSYFIVFYALLAEACAMIDDEARAATVYEKLLPYADLNITFLLAFAGGSVSRVLGLLATTLEQWDDAERHFRFALEHNERMRTPLWLAYTQYNYADMLRRRDGLDAAGRIKDLLDAAQVTASDFGFIALERKIVALRDECG